MKKLFSQYQGLNKEIYVIFACKLIDNLGSMVGPLLTLILSSKLSMSAGEIALWMSAYAIIGAPMMLIGGHLADKINKKMLINICDITTSIIYVLCGFMPFSKLTIIIYLSGCLLQQIENPAYDSLVPDFTLAAQREKAYSLCYLGSNLGLILAPILGSILINDYIELLFIFTGLSQLISIIVFDIFIKNSAVVVDKSNKYEDAIDSTNLFTILKDNKVIFCFIIVYAFSMFIYDQYGYLMPLTLDEVHGDLGTIYYGFLSSINCFVVILCTAVITTLTAKFISLNRTIISVFLELLGYVIFVIFIKKPIICYIAMIIFTFGEITGTITTQPYINKRIPSNYRGRINSFIRITELIIPTGGKIILGKIFDNYGYKVSWAIIMAVAVLTIFAYQLLKKGDKNRYPMLYEQHQG